MSSLCSAERWRILLVFLLPVVVYLNTLSNPFQYDDFHSIADNPHIRTLANVPAFFSDPTLFSERPKSAMYRPLLLSTFALNYAISGSKTWSYHLLNMAIHGMCGLLVFVLGRALLNETRPALIGALLFGVHPVNSEAVNYISSRSEILAALFFLLAFHLATIREGGVVRFAIVGGAFAAGLLSKSIVCVFPAVLWTRDLLIRCRRGREGRTALYAVLVVLATGYLGIVWSFLHKASFRAPVRSLPEQISTQIKASVFYLKLLAVPTGLTVDHQFLISDTPFDPISGPAGLFVLSLLFIAFGAARSKPIYLFSIGWFLIVLAPSSLIPLNVLVNEHRLYLPSVSFALVTGLTLKRFGSSHERRRIRGMIPVVLIGLLGVATTQRNTVWGSAYDLWEDAASKAPLMARPHIFLGAAHFEDGNLAKAVKEFETVLIRDPGFGPAYMRSAELYRAMGNAAAAVEISRRGVAAMPENSDLWEALGEQHRQSQDFHASRDAYLRAVELDPEDGGLRNNLGNLYQLLNQPNEALIHHMKAIEVEPSDPRSWLNAGNAHQMMQSYDNAEAAYAEAVLLDPQYAEAWLNMGGLYDRLGRKDDARNALERAAAIKPTSNPATQR